MFKKISLSFVSIFLLFSLFSFCFANDMMTNLENDFNTMTEDAKDGIDNTIDNINTTTEDMMNNAEEKMDNMTNDISSTMSTTPSPSTYTTERTSTTTDTTLMGMTGNMWTWLIVAAAALVVFGLVWYYIAQRREINHYHDND